MGFLTPFLLEIILVEGYLMLGRKIKFHLMKFILNVTALGSAIVNLCLCFNCDSYKRDVKKSFFKLIQKVTFNMF